MVNQLQVRAERLRERMEEDHGPILRYLWAAVQCNGCGTVVKARTPEQLAKMLPGWRIGGYGGDDYCPGCLG